MRKVRDVQVFVYLSVAAAAVLAVGVGAWRPYADEGYSDEIRVFVSSLGTDGLVIYTPGGEVQETMPIGVRSQVGREPIAFGQTLLPALSMDITTGGTVEVTAGAPSVVDPIESVTGHLEGYSPTGSFYYSVINAALLEFDEVSRGGASALVAEDFLRAVAVVDSYYFKGETTADLVQDMLDITILDADEVDADGNGIPDATALLEPFTLMMGPNGNITMVVDLGALDDRGDAFNGNAEIALLAEDGPMRIRVDAPTMNQLAAANAAYNLYAGRLIVTVSEDATDLIDIPADADPAADFDLEDGGSPLPEPQGVFIRTAIALTDAVDLRGAAPEWTFLDALPGGLEVEIEISGPGVWDSLVPGDLGFGYQFATGVTQTGEDILIEDGDGWDFADFDVANFVNGDEFERGSGNEVETGDDTLFFVSQNASGIYASNLMPRVTEEDDDDDDDHHGLCFIATAAYGTPMAAEIDSLRDVRDAYMLGNPLGTAFVDAYYRVSPPVARMVSEYPMLKSATRAVLTPVVAMSGWTMQAPGIMATVAVLLLLGAMGMMRRMGLSRARK